MFIVQIFKHGPLILIITVDQRVIFYMYQFQIEQRKTRQTYIGSDLYLRIRNIQNNYRIKGSTGFSCLHMSIVLFTVKGNKKKWRFRKNGSLCQEWGDYECRKVSFFFSLQIVTIVNLNYYVLIQIYLFSVNCELKYLLNFLN